MKKPLIILTGPTSVGKTSLSISLAKQVNGEIISADSMQVYKQMDIGSAKITPAEMDGVKHYLIDELQPEEEFHVVHFQKMAHRYMKLIYKKGKIPILVGGTGFYIQSILYEIDFTENEGSPKYREEMKQLAEQRGEEALHGILKQIDPVSADKIHAHNVKRVIRALEYYQQTGQCISDHNAEQRLKESPYNFAYFVLTDEREVLYKKIDARVDRMMMDGLLEEVQKLKQNGYTKNLVSMQGLGYKELLSHLDGEITLEEAVYLIKRDTRHFAKRQLTWFKREKNPIILNRTQWKSDDQILAEMGRILAEKGVVTSYGTKGADQYI